MSYYHSELTFLLFTISFACCRHKFGFRYWFIRFLVVFVFFLMIVIITAQQIAYSTVEFHVENVANRYMDSWRPFIMVAIAFGVGLCGYEVMQFIYAPRKYIK